MNSLDQLSHLSEVLHEVIDELICLIRFAKDEIDKGNFDQRQWSTINDFIKKTLNLANLFLDNYNEFMEVEIS